VAAGDAGPDANNKPRRLSPCPLVTCPESERSAGCWVGKMLLGEGWSERGSLDVLAGWSLWVLLVEGCC